MTSEIDKMTKALKLWVDQHTILERARQSFFRYLEIYQRDEPEEIELVFPDFQRDYFTIQVQKITCGMSWPDGDFCYIDAFIPLLYKQENFGSYRALFLLSGEFWDDVWHFNEEIVQQIINFRPIE